MQGICKVSLVHRQRGPLHTNAQEWTLWCYGLRLVHDKITSCIFIRFSSMCCNEFHIHFSKLPNVILQPYITNFYAHKFPRYYRFDSYIHFLRWKITLKGIYTYISFIDSIKSIGRVRMFFFSSCTAKLCPLKASWNKIHWEFQVFDMQINSTSMINLLKIKRNLLNL